MIPLVLGLVTARESHADTALDPHYPAPLTTTLWRHEWPTFSAWKGVATIAAGTGASFVLEPPPKARWQGGVLFDDTVRDAMRLESASARKKARAVGDLPYYAAPAIPLVIDPLVAAWIARGDTKTAVNLELMSLEAFSYAGDRHDTSEVLAGFGVGFGVGYAVPTMLHYTRDKNAGKRPNVSFSVSPGAPCTGACLKVAGSF